MSLAEFFQPYKLYYIENSQSLFWYNEIKSWNATCEDVNLLYELCVQKNISFKFIHFVREELLNMSPIFRDILIETMQTILPNCSYELFVHTMNDNTNPSLFNYPDYLTRKEYF